MRFSLNFLREFVEIDMPAKELAAVLTMAGMEVEEIQHLGSDWVFDIEITTNRYDWLSHLGVAREIAACLDRKLKLDFPVSVKKPGLAGRKVIIENTGDCQFYLARSLRGAQIKIAPAWLIERLANCGLNSVNNAVDIANYCMLKWGNPLHVFDQDKLEGDLYVRRAVSGERFLGLDDKERVLAPENLVIADAKKVVALAGVIGGKNTAVESGTKNIFLEAAIFSPFVVRQSRRSAGLNTDSSYRFERMVHPDCLEYASAQASQLIQELCGAEFCGYAASGKKPKVKIKKITCVVADLNKYLGTSLTAGGVKKILVRLGFKLQKSGSEKVTVLSPALRFDQQREVDVYEEVARIYGYDNIEPTQPFLTNYDSGFLSSCYNFKKELRGVCAALGFNEVQTYSIVAEEDLAKLGEKDFILLSNPLRKQENAMRPSLLTGMLAVARYNLNRQASGLRLFELADTFRKTVDGYDEQPELSLALCGDEEDFFILKGAVQEVLKVLYIPNLEYTQQARANFSSALTVKSGASELGFLGKLDPQKVREFDLKENLFYCQLSLGQLQKTRGRLVYQLFSQYPAVWRDISLAVSREKKFRELEKLIRANGGEFLVSLSLIDRYQGKDLPAGTQAFTLRLFYQSRERTLSAQEVDALHNAVRSALVSSSGVSLR